VIFGLRLFLFSAIGLPVHQVGRYDIVTAPADDRLQLRRYQKSYPCRVTGLDCALETIREAA
jgi:hypothetical protein